MFAAGQIASDYQTGVPPEARKKDGFPFYGSDIELQTAYILENLKQTFEAAGSSRSTRSSRRRCFSPISKLPWLRRGVEALFQAPPPRTTIGSTGLLVKDTLVEIDLIGTKN